MKTIFGFEVLYLLRRPATWIYFALLFFLAFLFMTTDAIMLGGGVGKVLKNSPFVIAQSFVMLTLIGSLITTALAGTSVLRDFELGVHSIFFTKPITKTQYLLGRFLGAYFVMLFVYFAMPLGMMLGSFMPWIDHEKIGAFRIEAFLQPYFVFVVPNILFLSALFFAVGTLTRNMFAVYVQGIVLFVLFVISSSLLGKLENDTLSSALDPFGISSFYYATRYWTVVEKNEMMVPLWGFVLTNRLIWIGIGVAIFGLCFRLFRFDVQPLNIFSKKKRIQTDLPDEIGTSSLVLPVVSQKFGGFANVQHLISHVAMYFKSMIKDVLFLALAAIGFIVSILNVYNADSIFGTSVYPVSYLLVENLRQLILFILLISTFYGGELIWRERKFKVNQITDALPIKSVTSFVAKVIALIGAQMLLILSLIFGAIIVQMTKGYFNFEPKIYAHFFFLSMLPKVALFSMFALSVHVLVNNKYIGHFITVIVWISTITLSAFKFNHNLYHFLTTPEGTYSAMNGWGSFEPRFYSYVAYWLSVCLLLCWIAYLFLVRGTEETWKSRMTAMRERMTPLVKSLGTIFLATSLGMGGFIFYNSNILNTYRGEKTVLAQQNKYEIRYKHFGAKPQPHVIASSIFIDLVPEELRYSAHGSYTLKNNYPTPIDSILVFLDDETNYNELTFSRSFSEAVNDKEVNARIFKLNQPLLPQDSVVFSFRLKYASKGFKNSGINTSITYNGTFLNNGIFPQIGYDENGEISDEDDRKKQSLPPRSRMANVDDTTARMKNYISGSADWMNFEITVSTAPDQIAIAPGYIQREWNENGRRYFTYKMDAPILNFYSILSARYEVKRDTFNGVNIEIFYNKGHEYNLDRMITAVKKSLEYYVKNFAPYQFRQLRILEFPRYATFAQSFPNTIPYSEGIGFIARVNSDDDIDYPFYITAHEVGHQWWGHQVVGANVQGATMLSESFAEYSSLMVMKHEYGEETMKKFLSYSLNSYLRGRSEEREKEQPLMLNENQQYIHYQKGSLVLYALADHIGEDSLNAAMSRFCKDKRFQKPPYTTTKEFLTYLRPVVPDSLKYLVQDMFETITLYDNRIKTATYSKQVDGTYQVKITVESKKFRADSLGRETSIPMSDYIDIGIFDDKESKKTKLGVPLYFKKHKISEAMTQFEFNVKSKPQKAGIDPYNKLIDRNAEDNVKEISEQ